jgi:hypothetical protein
MTLQSTAQELQLIPIAGPALEVQDLAPESHMHHDHEHEPILEVSSPMTEDAMTDPVIDIKDSNVEINISLDDVPGAPEAGEILEVSESTDKEAPIEVEEKEEDNNDAKSKSKKNEKWDWASKGASGFVLWIKERFNTVPNHSGYDIAGLERAISYLDKLETEISKAMRLDIDGELDANKVEEVRAKIEEGIERLEERIDKIKSNKKKNRKKKAELETPGFIKDAQKITGVKGTFITVPLLISGIARVCINGTVSAGHDIEKTFADQAKKYKLNDREKSEVRWLLLDMGYPLRGDRGFMPDEDFDATSSDNYDYMAQYQS